MESQPSIELDDLIGTPITGRLVREAIIPGRWAAPPAPAIMTFRPRPAASHAYLTMRCGVRWAETTVSSKGISNSSSISAAAFMIVRSLSLPMITPTSGVLISVFLGSYASVPHLHDGLFPGG